jgi:hypothetical protein
MLISQRTKWIKDPGLTKLSFSSLLSVLLIGCSDLQPVADFGKNGSKIAANQDVANDYVPVVQRTKTYEEASENSTQTEKPDAAADQRVAERNQRMDQLIAERKQQADQLRKAQQVLQAYAQALGALAAADLINYDSQIDDLNKSLVDAQLATSTQTAGYAEIAKLTLRLGTDIYRRQKIRSLIKTYNPYVQKATQNLARLVDGVYGTDLQGERERFETLVADTAKKESPVTGGLKAIVGIVQAQQEDLLDKRKQNAKALVAGIRAFGDGHQKLADNVDKVSFKVTASIAKDYADRLRDILKSFRS